MHRNLDIDNVLIDENFEPKLCGFKYAKNVGNGLYMTMAIGSPLYMAPEIFLDGDEYYTFSADVFAYGMILYRMFSTKLEFANVKVLRSVQQFLMKIGNGIRPIKPENMPDSYWELINRCWDQDESKRPTFQEIVEELKSDKYSIEEFGMKTNVDELHEYQRKVDPNKYEYEYESERTAESSESEESPKNSDEKQNQIEELESIILPPNYNISFEKCVFDEEDEKFHQVLSRIGEGATSIAYKIFDQRTGQVMCKKVLKIVNNDRLAFKALQNSIKEFEVLSHLNHPCICRAIGINTSEFVKDTNVNTNEVTDVTTVALFLEFQDYSITDYIKNMNNTLKTKIVVEIVHAMNFIHKKGLIHRDLKIDNIRLNCIFEAKIIDFGLVRIHEILSDKYSFVQESMTKGVGTFAYMSPEMLNQEDYDYKTDVYSFGIVLYFLFVGSLPTQSLRDKLIGKKVEMPSPSHSISKCCIELISKCLSFKPSDRPSFDEILKFISDNNFNLASFVDQQIVSRRNRELIYFEKSKK